LIDNYIKILANQFFQFTGERDNAFTPGFAAGGFSRLHFPLPAPRLPNFCCPRLNPNLKTASYAG
jgi:hypothetical protein